MKNLYNVFCSCGSPDPGLTVRRIAQNVAGYSRARSCAGYHVQTQAAIEHLPYASAVAIHKVKVIRTGFTEVR